MSAPISRLLTPKKRERFLETLAKTGNVTRAAKSVHTSTFTVYLHRRKDPAFKAAWDEALDTAMDTVLEPEAIRRAVEGVEKPVYQGGEQIGSVREYSDTLLIFLLKGGRPHKYRDNYHVTGDASEPMILKVVYEESLPEVASPTTPQVLPASPKQLPPLTIEYDDATGVPPTNGKP